MLVLIVIVALFIGLFFLIAGISLVGFIYNGGKGNSDLQKKCLKILVPAAVIWLFFVLLNSVLIVIYLNKNGAEVIDFFKKLLEFFGI